MKQQQVRLGICGLGTVASGVINLFNQHASLVADRSGVSLELVHIGARRDNPLCDTSGFKVSRDIFEVARDPGVDVVIELIGGTTVALDLVQEALANGKHVITANKALIAEHGNTLIATAEKAGLALCFEAAVAGGIPVIKTLREALAGNRIESVAGIINGTGNFILTEMGAAGRSFDDVLAEAQALGYAEADPTFDVDGTDAAHKLVIIAAIAFGMPLDIHGPFCEGIDRVAPEDLKFAQELGYRIKHLGIARRVGDHVDLRVHPTLIPSNKQIANVDGVLNAITIAADGVGELVLVGPGAGSLPTASAVWSDIMDVARALANGQSHAVPALGVPLSKLNDPARVVKAQVQTPWYLRFSAQDRPGVMAEITQLLGAEGISIESLIQRPPAVGTKSVQVVMLTDAAAGAAIERAIAQIEALAAISGQVAALRVETFEGS